MNKLFILISFVLSFSSCSTIQKYSLISTKNIEWDRINEYKIDEQIVEDKHILTETIIIFQSIRIEYQDLNQTFLELVIENVLNKIPGAMALVDVEIKTTNFYIPFIYGNNSMMVKGKVLIDPKLEYFINNIDLSNNIKYLLNENDCLNIINNTFLN